MKKKTIASFAFACAAIICFACGINHSAFAASESFVLLNKPSVSVNKNNAVATIRLLVQDTTNGISRYDYVVTRTSNTTNETETVVDSADKNISVDRPNVINEFKIEVPNIEDGYTYNFHNLKITDSSKAIITNVPGEATFNYAKFGAITNTFAPNVESNLIVTQAPTVTFDRENKKIIITVTAKDDIAGVDSLSVSYKTIAEDGTEKLGANKNTSPTCVGVGETEAMCRDRLVKAQRTIDSNIKMEENLTYLVSRITISSTYGDYEYTFSGAVRASLADGIIENTLALADETGDDTGSGTGSNDNTPTDNDGDDAVEKDKQNTVTSNNKVSNPKTFDGTFVSAGVLVVSLATAFVAVSKFSRR